MKEYIEDTTAMIIYALQFIVPPIIAGALHGFCNYAEPKRNTKL